MQNQNLPLSKISRETYIVPKGEEQSVHYKAERVLYADGVRVSHPDLIKTDVKSFDVVKRNLELQGYTIEILHHPLGKYTNVTIPRDMKEEIAERDAEIAALKAQLAAAKAASADNAPEKEEAEEENPSEKEGEKEEKPDVKEEETPSEPKKKVGRPRKEE